MSHALRVAMAEAKTQQDVRQPCHTGKCEETGTFLFRAGEYVAPGDYQEVETKRWITLAAPGFLPACLDGRIACYRLAKRNWSDASEETLAQRQAQFQQLVANTHQRLYRHAQRNLRNRQDAEDVTQEALARAWTHFDKYDPQRSFESWVFRILNNLMIDLKRRQRRRPEVSLDASTAIGDESEGRHCTSSSEHTLDPQKRLMAELSGDELHFALSSLPQLQRATLLLVAQERSYKEIAQALDCPLGTIRSRVHRARAMLRRNLKARMFAE